MSAQIHKLKTFAKYWDAIASGAKTFEVRQYQAQFCRNCQACYDLCFKLCEFPTPARDFQPGDTLELVNNDTGDTLFATVTYVLMDTDFPQGIKPGYCVMGINARKLRKAEGMSGETDKKLKELNAEVEKKLKERMKETKPLTPEQQQFLTESTEKAKRETEALTKLRSPFARPGCCHCRRY